MPDVSVIVHARDAVPDLAACVRSALAQEGVDVQVVIVDDASTDDTPSLSARIAAAHPNIIAVSRLEATTDLAAFLDGATAATGEYACLVEATDRLRPDTLLPLVEAAREADADVVAPSIAIACGATAIVDAEVEAERSDRDDPVAEPETADATAQVPQLETPASGTYDAQGGQDALFVTHEVTCRVRGRLYATRLLRRALAEVADADLAQGEDEVVSFVVSCLAHGLVGAPGVVSAQMLDRPEGPATTLEALKERCRCRNALAATADYLDRSEGWEEHRRAWEGLALTLAGRCLAGFPEQVAPDDWPEAARTLLDCWGAPIVAAILSRRNARSQAIASMALASSPSLAREGGRASSVLLCVGEDADPGLVERAHMALAGRFAQVHVAADERTYLPGDLFSERSLPLGSGTLPRSRSLEAAIESLSAEVAVFFDSPERATWDELVARARGCATVLVLGEGDAVLADDPFAYDIDGLLPRAGEVAMAQVTVIPDGADGELLRLLGGRVATLEGLAAQLALGSSRSSGVRERLMAVRLLGTGFGSTRTIARMGAEVERLSASLAARVEGAPDGARDASSEGTVGDAPAEPSPYVVEERRKSLFRKRAARAKSGES